MMLTVIVNGASEGALAAARLKLILVSTMTADDVHLSHIFGHWTLQISSNIYSEKT